MKFSFKIFFMLSLAVFCSKAFGQMENGTYIGYEQNPFCYTKECLRDYKNDRGKKNKLYYKITLQIKDSVSSITKLPVKYISKKKQIVDSVNGGYYHYSKIGISDNNIFGRLDNCKYCKTGGHGVRRYNYLSYKISQVKGGLLLSNGYNRNIFLKKFK